MEPMGLARKSHILLRYGIDCRLDIFFFALKSGNTFCIPLMSSKVPSHSNRAQWDDMAAVPVHESSLLCSM